MTKKVEHQFIVVGSCYGDLGILHVEAPDRAAALAAFQDHYGDLVEGWDLSVSNLSETPTMRKWWRGHGHATPKGQLSLSSY